jgi:FAD/FMN-containing dehydrogenase
LTVTAIRLKLFLKSHTTLETSLSTNLFSMGDASTPSKDALLKELKTLVSPDEILTSDSPVWKTNTETWSAAHYLNPKLVLRPTSVESLSRIVAFVGKTDLDFKVRSQGYGNASAKDVLISLTAFDQFEWDEKNKVVTLGPGMPWAKYYDEMPKVAPGWTSRYTQSLEYFLS